MELKRKCESLVNYINVFSTPFDALKFRKVYKNKIKDLSTIVSIRVRETNHPLLCRPNTTDAQVLWDTFYRKYHLPPVELGKEPVIVDLGANVGYTMAHFAFLYPSAHIYGVEMNYENFVMAKKNLASLEDQCVIMHSAVWFENGRVSYGGESEWGYSIVRKSNNKDTNVEYQVPAKTLDVIFNEYELKRVDYLKMDIEGAEKFVLQNPEKWINYVKSIKIEIHPPANFEESEKVLKIYGFRCSKDNYHPSCIIAIKD